MRRQPGPHATREEIAAWNAYVEQQTQFDSWFIRVVFVLAVAGALGTLIFR